MKPTQNAAAKKLSAQQSPSSWHFRFAAIAAAAFTTTAASLPPNLARSAKATATSEFSGQYLAQFAVDGKIPEAGSQDDLGQAWCVRGDTHRQGAELTLEWTNLVTIAEVVYYGRTAWFAEECWKVYEVTADGADAPVATGKFQMGHGPQRIRLAQPVATRRLILRFGSSYGGANPGASEVQVFASALPDDYFAKFRKLEPGRPDRGLGDDIVETPELAAQLRAGQLGFEQLLVVRRRELNPSHVYTYHVEGFGAGGGLYVAAMKPSGALRELAASPEGQILDCDVSFDGREILFSWRRKQGEGYQVFVINADGTNLRQLTDGAHHNYNACWLPDGGIAFLSTRSARFAYCWISPVGVLYRMTRDGADVQRLSANIVNDFTPSVLDDGRVIYSRWEYVDKPAIPIQSLWTIHPDGTGLAGFFGNRVLSPATFMEARSIPGTGKVLCLLTSHNGPCRGAIGIVDIAYGNNAPASIRNLTPEVNIGQADKGDGNNIRGPYENPFPLDEQRYLVSKRGTVLVRSYDGAQVAKVLLPGDGLGFYNPQPLRARKRPAVLVSGLKVGQSLERGRSPTAAAPSAMEASDFPNHSKSVPAATGGPVAVRETSATDSSDAVTWATVVLQDVYRGLEPLVKRGEVKEICVVEEMRKIVRTDVKNRAFGFQFPVISCGATYAAKKVWGYATVAPDGSACFKVPARRPIYFMALDAEGRAVQRMRTFTHLMPGETQGCIGCHEPRQQVAAAPQAVARVPEELRPPEWNDAVEWSAGLRPAFDGSPTTAFLENRLRAEQASTLPHPDPLPLGEGKAIAPHNSANAHPVISDSGHSQSLTTILPLPAGEGRGEGEAAKHQSPSDAPKTSSQASPHFVSQSRSQAGAPAVGFDYARIVQPVLDSHCVKCHSGATPPAKVDLCGDATDFFNVSYEVLARGRKRSGEAEWDSPFVNWIPTYNGMEQNILEVTPKAWGSPRSKLADVLRSGHPDTNGAPRLKMESRDIRRVLAWIDLNVPYYGTSETTHPETRGCRQLLPADLEKTLADVAKRRCAECHDSGKIPRQFWTRIVNPQMNNFLLAPLAKDAGGSGVCGKAVFQSADDPDYQAILRTFDPVLAQLRERPRTDMAGAKAVDVDRSCLGSLY